MTACVFITGNNGVETFSDGAAYDADGVFGHFSNKVALLSHLPAVVFARGGGSVCMFVKSMLAMAPSFDEMVKGLPRTLKMASVRAKIFAGDPLNIGVIVGGFSDSAQEWQTWRCAASMQDGVMDPENFTTWRVPSFYAEPWPDDEALANAGLGSVDDFKWSGTVADGISMLEAIRQTNNQLHPDNPTHGCLCGGFVERAVVTKEICTTEIVHRWPDVIGEKMNANVAA